MNKFTKLKNDFIADFMNKFTKLKNNFIADFKWQYWMLILVFVMILSLHIITQSTPLSYRFINYIQDFLPQAIAAAAGAIVANYINDYKDKSFKITPHVIYPIVSGTLLLFTILLFSGVFSTVEIRISGNGDGQFDGDEIQMINVDLAETYKNIRVSNDLNYQEIAPQDTVAPHSVNVNIIYDSLTNYIQIEGVEGKYDIYELDVIWIPHFKEKGWIIPLDEYLKTSDVRYSFGIEQEACKFVESKEGVTTLRTQTFAVPNFLNVGFLMYRTDLFHDLIEKDGEPETWDELIDWLREIKGKYGDKYDGFVFQGAQYEGLMVNYMEILWAYGGEIIEDEKGIPQVNTPEGIKALKFFKDLLEEGIIPNEVLDFDEADSFDHFSEGNTLVLRNWPRTFYGIQNHNKFKNLRNKVDVVSKPLSFRGVAKGAAKMCLGGWYYAISKNAHENGKAKQAMEVIEYLTSEKQYNETVNPTQLSIKKDPYSIRIPGDELFFEKVKEEEGLDYAYEYFNNRYYRARPKFPYYSDFSRILVKWIHQCLEDSDLTAEEALQNAQGELDETIPKIRGYSK